jgi:soluble lytic murein transglycosylase-like protein
MFTATTIIIAMLASENRNLVTFGQRLQPYQDLIQSAARRHELEPMDLIVTIIIESSGLPDAVGLKLESTGLMGIVPMTGRPDREQLLDPQTNIETGSRILARYLVRTNGHKELALFLYSGGGAWADYTQFERLYLKPWRALRGEIYFHTIQHEQVGRQLPE